MTWLLGLSRLIDRLTAFVGRWVAWFIFAATVVSAGNAVIRKVFDESSNAWLELQWYLFGAAYMLASAYTLQRNEHVRIDILYGMWPRRVQHWIDLIGHLQQPALVDGHAGSSCGGGRGWGLGQRGALEQGREPGAATRGGQAAISVSGP